jgi:mRNA interferase RelE/StbE
MYDVFIHKTAAKKIKKLPRDLKEKVLKHIDLLARQPYLGKRLHGELEGNRRLRVGDLRLIYGISEKEKTVIVHAIGSRGDIYK